MSFEQTQSINNEAHYPLPNVNDERKEEEDDDDLPAPSQHMLQFVEAKNKELELASSNNENHENHTNIFALSQDNNNYESSSLWKDKVEILQQRLDLANKIKRKAQKDGEFLKKQIKKQDNKLSELKELQSKMQRIKIESDRMREENQRLRQQIQQQTHNKYHDL